jgi:hypothetical protein
MKMEQTECSGTLAYKLQTPVNHPEESIQPISIMVMNYLLCCMDSHFLDDSQASNSEYPELGVLCVTSTAPK